MGFIGVTFGMAAPLLTNSGASLSGLTDGQAVIGDTLRVISADATPSWRSPTSEPGDEIASGDTWSVAGTDGTPLYVVAGSDTLGPYTLRNRSIWQVGALIWGQHSALGKLWNSAPPMPRSN